MAVQFPSSYTPYTPYGTPQLPPPSTFSMSTPGGYSTQAPANDAFYNAAAWRAAMPTPNLTFNYNMGTAQQQQPGYPSMQAYPQQPAYSPYAQTPQVSPYPQAGGAFPYQTAGAYAPQPSPYAMTPAMTQGYGYPQPGGFPQQGGYPTGMDMFNPAGAMTGMGAPTGMDALSNPATTDVNNLTQSAPLPAEEKKSSFWKWVGGLALAGAAIWAGFNWLGGNSTDNNGVQNTNTDSKTDENKDNKTTPLSDALSGLKTASDALLGAAEKLSGDAQAKVKDALTAHGELATELGENPDVTKLRKGEALEPSEKLDNTQKSLSTATSTVEKALTEANQLKDDDTTKTEKVPHLEAAKKQLADMTQHVNSLVEQAKTADKKEETSA